MTTIEHLPTPNNTDGDRFDRHLETQRIHDEVRDLIDGLGGEILGKLKNDAKKINGGVRALQEKLLGSGYPIAIDGIVGMQTHAALVKYQMKMGIEKAEWGKLGTESLDKLNLGTLIKPEKNPETRHRLVEGTGEFEGVKLSQSDLNMIAKMCYAEAKGEGIEGQKAVAAVICNRLKSPLFPNSVSRILFAKTRKGLAEFSPIDNGSFNKSPVNQDLVKAVALLLKDGTDPTNGALFFQAKYVEGWINRTRRIVAVIGNHNFFA